MKLERVEISGFKSFGEKVEVSFHQGVTAIVGPNGCGKSNIADAIGWVLGEQSAKTLRGTKMEDLIFNGSEARTPMSRAEVNLRVSRVRLDKSEDNGGGAVRLGDVLVTRRLYRSGDSEYLMDGRHCRLRDIHELFMGTGVGSKAYAIIEQGKIGLILSSKPTDRRVLIEEAAGITKYKSRRHSAELKLAAARQNLLRVNDIVYELERQMNSLKRQAGKARRYHRLRDAMNRLERVAGVKRDGRLFARLSEARERLQAVSDEELRRAVSLDTVESYLERMRLALTDREVASSDSRDRLHELELSIERLDNTVARDKQQLTELDERRDQLRSEISTLEARRGPVSQQLRSREEDAQSVQVELSEVEEVAERRESALKEANLAVAGIETEIEGKRSELVHRMSKIAALHNFLQGVVANSDKVSTELLKLEAEAREADAEWRHLEEERSRIRTELTERREEVSGLQSQRSETEHELEELRRALGGLEAEREKYREELSQLSARRQSLDELVQKRAQFRKGARELLTRGESHGVQVLGSVADFLEVDPELERVAELFFDEALQRVWVRNEDDARRAGEMLSASDEAGRSELLVESLLVEEPSPLRPALAELARAGVPGVRGLLSDGICWSGPGRHGLPDAIVVDSLEHALEAFRLQRVPFVTRDGEVVEPPGVIRVGPAGSSEGLLETKRLLREMEASIDRLKGRGRESQKEYDGLEAEIRERAERLESLREDLHEREKAVVGLEHREEQLSEEARRIERKREVLDSERTRSASERSALGTKRAEMEESLANEEEARNDAESSLESMRSKLTERRNGLSRLQARSAEESSRVAALTERVEAVRVDVARLREGIQELESRLAANRRETEEIGARKQGLAAEIARASEDLQESMRKREDETTRFRGLEAEASGLRERIERTDQALKERRRELETIREARSSEEVTVARQESEVSHLRSSFEATHGLGIDEAKALLVPADLAREDEVIETELVELKQKIDAIGPVNPMADEEFQELETRHQFVTRQRQDLLDSIASTETAIGRIDRTSRQRFREAFDAINREFEVTFKQLFGGGRAGLRLLDDEDFLESGLDIIAQPPGKRLQNVLLLSGGEKAMTAIALLFAIFRYRPSPFCLLDEVDAPLDDANVGRFLDMLLELRDTTQFIIITHNRKTMEMADHLYGVTMEEPGISKLVSVNMVQGAELAEPAAAVERA